VEVHHVNKAKGYFLSGGYFMLPMNISELISVDDITSQKCFDINWLLANGLKKSFKNNKLTAQGWKQKLLNSITTTKPTWNGHNASGWKEDILKVNGFDERMQYGGQDRELGERLFNSGVKSKQIRYSAVVIHLDHPRGYANKESWEINNNIRKNTRNNKVVKTKYGIEKLT
jgi:GT2 family glycosyltransferase